MTAPQAPTRMPVFELATDLDKVRVNVWALLTPDQQEAAALQVDVMMFLAEVWALLLCPRPPQPHTRWRDAVCALLSRKQRPHYAVPVPSSRRRGLVNVFAHVAGLAACFLIAENENEVQAFFLTTSVVVPQAPAQGGV